MNSLVSIVMPVYNAEKYLEECLLSITNQTYRNWELIAINDYSADQSKEILIDFANKDTRIQTFDNVVEKGITPSLKLAESKCRGQYITRMDADDKMHPKKIESLLAVAQKSENHLAIGLVKYFSEEKALGNGYKEYENWINLLAKNKSSFDEIYKECVIPSPSWMMNRKTFIKLGGFNAKMYPEDYDLSFRMLEAGLLIESTETPVHFWRDHTSRASRNDPNYLDNRFLELKVYYFLKLSRDKSPLLLWGAGKKGKSIAKLLSSHSIDFIWCTNNENKIGQNIYNQQIKPIPQDLSTFQIIVAVANKKEKENILAQINRSSNTNYFYFC